MSWLETADGTRQHAAVIGQCDECARLQLEWDLARFDPQKLRLRIAQRHLTAHMNEVLHVEPPDAGETDPTHPSALPCRSMNSRAPHRHPPLSGAGSKVTDGRRPVLGDLRLRHGDEQQRRSRSVDHGLRAVGIVVLGQRCRVHEQGAGGSPSSETET